MRASVAAGYGVGVLMALVVTVVLFTIMFMLIDTGDELLEPEPVLRLADVLLGDTSIDTRAKVIKPDKPEEPEEPPPSLDAPEQLRRFDIDTRISVSFAPQADVNIGIGALSAADGEYLPIVKVAPIYPRRAQVRGLQGYCVVEYTVTRTGAIRDPEAVDCKPRGIFERASVKAAGKFKYKPRVVDGEAVEVTGVRNKFTYKLE